MLYSITKSEFLLKLDEGKHDEILYDNFSTVIIYNFLFDVKSLNEVFVALHCGPKLNVHDFFFISDQDESKLSEKNNKTKE